MIAAHTAKLKPIENASKCHIRVVQAPLHGAPMRDWCAVCMQGGTETRPMARVSPNECTLKIVGMLRGGGGESFCVMFIE